MTKEAGQIWFALEIIADPAATEAVEHALNELDALGTEINHLRRKSDEAVTVVGYFVEFPSNEILQDELHYALRIYNLNEDAIKTVTRREVANEDWLSEWKKHWKPTEVGKFVVAPPWENVADDGRIVISIEPNMAFGTGTHETTQLCLKAIEQNFRAGQSFLDVGTGTGILAIAAAKLAEAQISDLKFLACDTDADSITIAKENAQLNGVALKIDFFTGPISTVIPVFDFICANLTIDVILPILPLLLAKARNTLVLSGVLLEQEELIVAPLVESGVHDFSIERLGEWLAVVVANGK